MNQGTKKKVFWITSTAMFVALLVVAQVLTSGLGNTIITGTVNNLLMILAVMTLGLGSGLTVAAVSPVVAKLIGIGPLWGVVPFILLGNLALTLVWKLLAPDIHAGQVAGAKAGGHRVLLARLLTAGVAAVVKFLVLYFGIVRIAVPVILQLPEQQAAVISGMFSFPQLITALAGGVIATVALPVLGKAVISINR